jgi:phage terminase small subunit
MGKRPEKLPYPAHLTESSGRWWAETVETFDLRPDHRKILTIAAQSWDRYEQAREILDREGISFLDRFGQVRPRPELSTERDAKMTFLRALRDLDHVLSWEEAGAAGGLPQVHYGQR